MSLLLQLIPLAQAPAHPGWLDAHERERLAGIHDPRRAAEFVAGHCLARQLAAELAGGHAPEWRFEVDGAGRRGLVHDQAGLRLHASISHARAGVAVAVATVPLGVDVEAAGQPRDWLRLAQAMFAPDEVQAVATATGPAREATFLCAWTLKEAWAKRSGRGLQRHEARACLAVDCGAAEAEAWTWRLADGGSLALAAAAGAQVQARGVAGEPRGWRYVAGSP
jgi:4'-phosphopantetheinyl transferase